MTSADRRRELRAQYEQRRVEAGVYAVRNAVTGRVLIGSTTDIGAVRNRLEFAQTTGTSSVFDHRLAADVREFGIGAFALDVLDELDVKPGTTPDDVRADLAALETLWREKLAGTPRY